jgi:hypothetical protein
MENPVTCQCVKERGIAAPEIIGTGTSRKEIKHMPLAVTVFQDLSTGVSRNGVEETGKRGDIPAKRDLSPILLGRVHPGKEILPGRQDFRPRLNGLIKLPLPGQE